METERLRSTKAFVTAIVVSAIFGVLWLGIVLAIRSLRDCPIMSSCNGVTRTERITDVLVWALGGLTWLALTVVVVRAVTSTRRYRWLFLSTLWLVLAVVASVSAIVATVRAG